MQADGKKRRADDREQGQTARNTGGQQGTWADDRAHGTNGGGIRADRAQTRVDEGANSGRFCYLKGNGHVQPTSFY